MLKSFYFSLAVVLASPSFAADKSPYAAETNRAIKALSPDDALGYASGKGLGYARAAELNGYPGPMHVLELSDKLNLNADQKTKTQAIFDQMKTRASETGKKIVAKEAELDRLFAEGSIDEAKLSGLTRDIAQLHGEYRFQHLQAHLEQKKILSEKQAKLYGDLRGYGKEDAGSHTHPH